MNCPERQKREVVDKLVVGVYPAVVCHASLCLVDDINEAFIIFIYPP